MVPSEMAVPVYKLEFEMPGQGEHWWEIRRITDDRRVASISIEFEPEAQAMVNALNLVERDDALRAALKEISRLQNIICTQCVEIAGLQRHLQDRDEPGTR